MKPEILRRGVYSFTESMLSEAKYSGRALSEAKGLATLDSAPQNDK